VCAHVQAAEQERRLEAARSDAAATREAVAAVVAAARSGLLAEAAAARDALAAEADEARDALRRAQADISVRGRGGKGTRRR
jgi:hypothetical protein